MQKLKAICDRDPRYDMEAYIFLREALDYTVKTLNAPARGERRHITGRELADGFRELALQAFGPLTLKVLSLWGIHRTEDIGEIVFTLVEAGELGKTEEDKREDFANGYNFQDVFEKPWLSNPDPPGKEYLA